MKRPRKVLATSFTSDEVESMRQLLKVLMRGGDARILARRKEIGKVFRKFEKLSAKDKGNP